MIKNLLLLLLLAAGTLSALPAHASTTKDLPLLKGVKRILFLGDSITYAGGYVDYVQAYLETHCPDKSYDIIDMGLPSETVSGLTEPGHAGGAFPRPVLSERLDRVLSRVKPDLVFACYGMNDGIYYPFAEERFAKYRTGIQSLVDKVKAAKARIILITPPPFDAVPVKGHTLPAGLAEYRQPYEGYDDVLGKYSDWLLEQRKRGWHVIDIHTPINNYLADQRKLNPDFRLAGDGVHIDANGHWLIADQILTYLGGSKRSTTITVDARSHIIRGVTGSVKVSSNYIQAEFQTPLPMPIDPALSLTSDQRSSVHELYDTVLFKVTNVTEAASQVAINGTDIRTFTRGELETGIPMSSQIATLAGDRDNKLLASVHTVRAMLTDAWLTEVGHKRPGKSQGLPIDQATEKAHELESQIKSLAAPVTLRIEIRPTGPL